MCGNKRRTPIADSQPCITLDYDERYYFKIYILAKDPLSGDETLSHVCHPLLPSWGHT